MRVDGLAELQRSLRDMDRSLLPVLRAANKSVATEVAQDAKSRALGIEKGGQRLARAISAVAQQRSAGVQIRDWGNTRGALGFEFGAGRDAIRDRVTGKYVGFRQFDDWAGHRGYALYPAVREAVPGLPEKYADALDPLLNRAFPD